MGLGRDGTLHGTYESRSCLFPLGRPVSRKACKTKTKEHHSLEMYSTFLNQVFLLDSQVNNPSTLQQETHGPANEEDDQRSYVFVLSSVENKEKPENAERYLALLMLNHVDLLDTLIRY